MQADALPSEPPQKPQKSGLPFPSPGDLPHLGIEPRSPLMASRYFTLWAIRKPKERETANESPPTCPFNSRVPNNLQIYVHTHTHVYILRFHFRSIQSWALAKSHTTYSELVCGAGAESGGEAGAEVTTGNRKTLLSSCDCSLWGHRCLQSKQRGALIEKSRAYFREVVQSTSCEMPDWMKHKLESRLKGKI